MVYLNYLWSLMQHKWYVFQAGLLIGVPVWRLIVHDWQKFTLSEFPKYARYFFGGKRDEDKEDFMYAWLHHVHHGRHHWEYWRLNPNYNFATAVNGNLPMPETYVREMVADWMGASKTYTGSWNMSAWLSNNGWRMDPNMHEDTVAIVHKVLIELGYFFTDNAPWICTWNDGVLNE